MVNVDFNEFFKAYGRQVVQGEWRGATPAEYLSLMGVAIRCFTHRYEECHLNQKGCIQQMYRPARSRFRGYTSFTVNDHRRVDYPDMRFSDGR